MVALREPGVLGAMAQHEVTFPIEDPAEILKLRAGDEVTVQGHIIGIRDRTQIRIFDQGVEPPMDLTGAFLLHKAGHLSGKRATTHWSQLDDLRALGDVEVVEERWVHDGHTIALAQARP